MVSATCPVGSGVTSVMQKEQRQVTVLEQKHESIGTVVWPAGRVMLSWMTTSSDAPKLDGTTILELGAGCGALAMGLIAQAGVRQIYTSEGEPEVLENLRANVAFNEMGAAVVPCLWDWEDSLAPPAEVDLDAVDLVIGSDIVYLGTGECRLSHALAGLCRPTSLGGRGLKAWLLLADRPQGGEQFLPAFELDEGVDPQFDEEGQRLSAVGRFLKACARRGLSVQELDIDPSLVEAATEEAGCVGGRREFEGRLALYCVQHS